MLYAMHEPPPRWFSERINQDRPVTGGASFWCSDVSAQRFVQTDNVPDARDLCFAGVCIKLRRSSVVGNVPAPVYVASHNLSRSAPCTFPPECSPPSAAEEAASDMAEVIEVYSQPRMLLIDRVTMPSLRRTTVMIAIITGFLVQG